MYSLTMKLNQISNRGDSMLEHIISTNLIKINVEASDWKDAIIKAATPLVDSGAITSNYIQGIFDSVKEIGPYFVITPHVALAHAPSKYGAKKLAMGVTILKTAVPFHSKDNDPVKYIFTLSSPDSTDHLTVIQDFVALLSDKNFLINLDAAKSAKEVLDIMSKHPVKN